MLARPLPSCATPSIPDGKFLLQIGKPGVSGGSNATDQLGRPASMEADPAANELYIADGYQNKRVIVFVARGADEIDAARKLPRPFFNATVDAGMFHLAEGDRGDREGARQYGP